MSVYVLTLQYQASDTCTDDSIVQIYAVNQLCQSCYSQHTMQQHAVSFLFFKEVPETSVSVSESENKF